MELKDKIKELRVKNLLTQEQLAEKLNVSRQTVSKYELGINEPDIATLKLMCEIFECEIGDLIDINNKTLRARKFDRANKILIKVVVALTIFGIFSLFVFVRFLPETVTLHYDINFNPDRTGSKYELLLMTGVYAIPILIITMFKMFQMRIEHYKEANELAINIGALIVTIVYIVLTYVFSFMMFENIAKIFPNILVSLVGGLICLLAVFSNPFINKINFFFGYRTRYSLSSSKAWFKLNLCQCIVGGLAGLICVILGLTIINGYVMFTIFALPGSVFVTLIYELVLKIMDKKEK